MAFFDKVGEVISSKSKDVAKKAKELAEISSLNGQINSQEEIISKTYIEIGKWYFDNHKDIENDEHAQQCNKIKEALITIEELRQCIYDIKGVQVCSSCGINVPLDSLFCANCGNKVQVTTLNAEDDIV